MHAEAEVGLVVAHAERRGGHERLHLVAEQGVLEPLALPVVELPGVGGHRHGVAVVIRDRRRQPVRVGHRQRVDDARPRQAGQVLDDPGEPLERREPVEHRQLQARPREGPAQHERRRAELRRHVVGHARVGGRGGGEDGRLRLHPADHVGDPPVVGAEVVAPVGDGVGLVDHEHPEPTDQRVEHPSPEARVRQALGRDQQHVEGAREQVPLDRLPVGDVRRVESRRAQAGPCGGRDLVAHQRQQRRHDERGAGTLVAPDRRRGPVHGRLAPARRLNQQHPRARLAQRGDRPRLVVAQPGTRPGDALDHARGDPPPGGAQLRHAPSLTDRPPRCRGPPPRVDDGPARAVDSRRTSPDHTRTPWPTRRRTRCG